MPCWIGDESFDIATFPFKSVALEGQQDLLLSRPKC